MTIENSSLTLSGVRASISTRTLSVAVLVWVWLEATLGTVDFSKSSGPPTDGVTVNRRGIRTSAEDSTSHLSFCFLFLSSLTSTSQLQTHRFTDAPVCHMSRGPCVQELHRGAERFLPSVLAEHNT